MEKMWDTWVAQSMTLGQTSVGLTLGFSTGHDLMVCEIEPCVRLCTDSVETAWDSPSLSAPLLLFLSLSLKTNKERNKQT